MPYHSSFSNNRTPRKCVASTVWTWRLMYMWVKDKFMEKNFTTWTEIVRDVQGMNNANFLSIRIPVVPRSSWNHGDVQCTSTLYSMKPYNQDLSSLAQLSEQLVLLTAAMTATIKSQHQLYNGLHFGSESSTGQLDWVRGPRTWRKGGRMMILSM